MTTRILVLLFIAIFCSPSFASEGTPVNFAIASILDSSGSPLSGGKVYFLNAGASTLTDTKSIYSDKAMSSAAANPVILDSMGRMSSIRYADGLYKIAIYTSADVSVLTYDNYRFSNSGSFVTASVAVSSTTTASALGYTEINVLAGGGFVVASGQTFTIDVPFKAGLFQVFSGSGTVSFSSGSTEFVYPEWFGVNTTPGTTDMTSAISKAITAAPNYSTVILSNQYLCDTVTITRDNVTIKGGWLKKKTDASAAASFLVLNSVENVTIDSVKITNSTQTTTSNGKAYIYFTTSDNVRVINCTLSDSHAGGIYANECIDVLIQGNNISNTQDNAILVGGGAATHSAEKIRIIGNSIDTTVGMNGIFVTASFGSVSTSYYATDFVVDGNTVIDAGDTAIEIGIHSSDGVVSNNVIKNSKHPGLLARDVKNVKFIGNEIYNGAATLDDAIAVVLQTESISWNSGLTIENNHIYGVPARSGIYLGQSGVSVSGNYFKPGSSASYGILLAPAATPTMSDVRIHGNYVEDSVTAIELNYSANPVVLDNVSLRGNSFYNCTTEIGFYNITPTNFQINEKYHKSFTVPDTQLDSVEFTTKQNVIYPMRFTVSFDNGIEQGVFLVGYNAGTIGVTLNSGNIVNGLSGSNGWGFGNSSGSLILQRRGTTVTPATGKMKVTYEFQ